MNDDVREPGTRVIIRYLGLPPRCAVVVGTGHNGVTGTPNRDIIDVVLEASPNDPPWKSQRASYHVDFVSPIEVARDEV